MNKDSNLLVSNYFGNCNLPLAFFSLNLVFIDLNREAARILGYSKDEIVGQLFSDVNAKESLHINAKEIDDLIHSKIDHQIFRIDFQSKSGRVIPLTFTLSLLESEETKIFVAVFHRSIGQGDVGDFLSDSFNNFGHIANLNPDIHYLLDVEKEKYIYQSIPLLNYCGYLMSDLGQEKEIDFLMQKIDEVNIESHSNVKTFFKEKKGIEEFVEIEYRILTKYNGRKWLKIKTIPLLLLKDNNTKLSYGFIEDITDSKKNFELERSRLKLSDQVSNHSTDIIYLTNIDSKKIIYTNFGQRKFLDYNEAEWCNPMLIKLHPDFVNTYESHFNRLSVVSDESVVYDELRFIDKQGLDQWVLIKSKVFSRDNHHLPYLILSSAININAYKSGFHNLSLAQSTTNAIVRAIPDMLLLMDTKGNYLKAISGVSFEKVEADSLVGKNVHDVLPPEIAEEVLENIHLCLQSNEVRSIEFNLIEDGNYVYYSNNFSKLNNENVLILVRDITSRKITELELEKKVNLLSKKNEQLEQFINKNTELERFAYIISHDLKEPLRSINSMAEIINQQIRALKDPKLEKLMQHLMDSSERMNLMIEGVLDYSRLDSQIEEHKAVDLNLLLADVESDLSVLVKERNAKLLVSDLPKVIGDEIQLRQLFQNLINNAIKFNKNKQATVTIGSKIEEGETVFFVKDNGIGIDKQFAESIFKMFRKLNSNSEYPGQGLGLSICKKIVDRHEGRIWMESNGSSGSTFFFTLKVE